MKIIAMFLAGGLAAACGVLPATTSSTATATGTGTSATVATVASEGVGGIGADVPTATDQAPTASDGGVAVATGASVNAASAAAVASGSTDQDIDFSRADSRSSLAFALGTHFDDTSPWFSHLTTGQGVQFTNGVYAFDGQGALVFDGSRIPRIVDESIGMYVELTPDPRATTGDFTVFARKSTDNSGYSYMMELAHGVVATEFFVLGCLESAETLMGKTPLTPALPIRCRCG